MELFDVQVYRFCHNRLSCLAQNIEGNICFEDGKYYTYLIDTVAMLLYSI
jgi:hypothetical protein